MLEALQIFDGRKASFYRLNRMKSNLQYFQEIFERKFSFPLLHTAFGEVSHNRRLVHGLFRNNVDGYVGTNHQTGIGLGDL